MPNFAEKTAPFWDLIKKNAIFSWSSELEKSFRAINDQILHGITLALPNVDNGLVLLTDASALGVAGYLVQIDKKTKEEEPLIFVSRKLKDPKKIPWYRTRIIGHYILS